MTGTVAGEFTIDDTITLTVNGNPVTGTVDGSGNFSINVPGSDLSADGDTTIDASITTTDAAGNSGTATVTKTYSVDTTAPVAPTVSSFSDDTGIANDNITSDNVPTFAGRAEANSVVEVLLNGTGLGSTTANSTGDWSFSYSGIPLADNTYSVTATSTDAAGNSASSVTPLVVTIDANAPIAPVITTPIEGDNIIDPTEQTSVLVAGTAEANTTVEVTISDEVNSLTALDTTDGSGNWTLSGKEIDVSTLNDGSLTVSATATDAAGNVSVAATAPVTKDTTAPTLSSITRQTPTSEMTNADSLTFRVTFDEDVQNVNADDFVVTGTTASISTMTPVDAATYDITVSGGDLDELDGPVGIDLANGQDIQDLVGNALPAGEPTTDQTYTLLNNTAPSIATTSFTAQENQTTAADVTATDARDTEGVGGLTYAITDDLGTGTDNSLFTIDTNTGVLTFNWTVRSFSCFCMRSLSAGVAIA